MKIVSDSSPLIVLGKIGRIALLKQLFASVYIPEKVYAECYEAKRSHCPDWINLVTVKDQMAVDALETIVDRGEAEAIILAREMKIRHILMDDKKGVNLAKMMGLDPVRTTTVLGIAYKNGLITDIRQELLNLREKGYWITDYYVDEILKRFKVDR